jgi:hypothetical protein
VWYDIDAEHNVIKLPEGASPAMDWHTRRRVAMTERILGSPAWVSTVFLGLDHGWGESAAPILFESMAFAIPGQQEAGSMAECHCDRYCTWAEAEAGHARMVALVEVEVRTWQAAQAPPPRDPVALRSAARQIDLDD